MLFLRKEIKDETGFEKKKCHNVQMYMFFLLWYKSRVSTIADRRYIFFTS